jgi:hypothetical protein
MNKADIALAMVVSATFAAATSTQLTKSLAQTDEVVKLVEKYKSIADEAIKQRDAIIATRPARASIGCSFESGFASPPYGRWYMKVEGIEFRGPVAIDVTAFCNGEPVPIYAKNNVLGGSVRINDIAAVSIAGTRLVDGDSSGAAP